MSEAEITPPEGGTVEDSGVLKAIGIMLLGIFLISCMDAMLKWLGENWRGPISVLPNAGLPELVDGETRYPLAPKELASWLERFVAEDGVNMISGCCGTTAEHIFHRAPCSTLAVKPREFHYDAE